MREDFIETLDKMFPDGYAIVYTNPDGQVRFNHYNPHGDPTLNRFHEYAKEQK